MSFRIKKETKKTKEKSDLIQEFIPENCLPKSWYENDYRKYSGLMERHWITEWRDEKGRLYLYTQREQEDEFSLDKTFIPYTYWKHPGSDRGFCMSKGWNGKKCLYNSKKILETDKPVLLGEGETVLHYALNNEFISENYLPTAFYGGVENWRDFNWDILKHKTVILCPDNDDPGIRCMHRIGHHLISKDITTKVYYLNFAQRFPGVFKSGWDIADEWPDSFKVEEVFRINSVYLSGFEKSIDENLIKEIEKEEREIEGEKRAKGLMGQYCYVMGNDLFNKIGSDDFYNKIQINNYYANKTTKIADRWLKEDEFQRAEVFITHAGFPPGIIDLKLGDITLMSSGKALNIYSPNYLEPKKGDISIVEDHYNWLLGKDKWEVLKKWIAYHIQYPGKKIKWSCVLVSVIEGTGKGALARILSRVLGEKNVNENANYKHLTNTHNTLLVGKQVVVLNEISMGDFKSKKEGTNALKNFIADDVYTCNFKGKPMTTLVNLTNFMLFSNDPQVLSVSNGSRRYFFCNIDKTETDIIKKTEEGFYKRLFDFIESDEGASALLYHFKNEVSVDVELMKSRAPITDDLRELIDQSKHPVHKKLTYDLRVKKELIFDRSFCGLITLEELNLKLSKKADGQFSKQIDWGSYGDDALLKFLQDECTPWNNGKPTRQIDINGHRVRMYLLDDSKCPIPGKSYKDLTPKQIASCFENYHSIVSFQKKEPEEYQEAQENIDDQLEAIKKEIEDRAKDKFWNKKGHTPEKMFEDWMNGHPPLDKTGEDLVKKYNKYKLILDTGLRTAEQIVEDPHKINPKVDPNETPEGM